MKNVLFVSINFLQVFHELDLRGFPEVFNQETCALIRAWEGVWAEAKSILSEDQFRSRTSKIISAIFSDAPC